MIQALYISLLIHVSLPMTLFGIFDQYRSSLCKLPKVPSIFTFPNASFHEALLLRLQGGNPVAPMPSFQRNTRLKPNTSKTTTLKLHVAAGKNPVQITASTTTEITAKPKVVVKHHAIHSRPKKKPRPIPKQITPTLINDMPPTTDKQKVYILQLQNNKIYVGKSHDVTHRLIQHMQANGHHGNPFIAKYKPTGIFLPRLGNVTGAGDCQERDETLRHMYRYGAENVRGWKYVSLVLTPKDLHEIEADIRELFDLCRRCGKQGHFRSQCKEKINRFGNKIT